MIEEGSDMLFVESTLKGYAIEGGDGKIGVGRDFLAFPVGTLISERPPDSSEQAQFGHSAPTLGV